MKLTRLAVVVVAGTLVAFAGVAIRQALGQQLAPVPGQQQAPAGPQYLGSQPRFFAGGYGNIAGFQSDKDMAKLLGEEGELERKSAGLVQQYSHTEDEAKRRKIRSELSDVLDKQFDLQQKRRDLEIKRIEAQLKRVRELMQKRADARQTIVERRLDQLLREAEGLGWTAPAGPHLPQLGGYSGPVQVR